MERLTLKEGLLDYDIWDLCQDKYGFLWIASIVGLQKFDGIHFTNFQYNPADSNSISSDYITSVFEDSKGRLWVGTMGSGLNLYNREKNTFKRYNKYPIVHSWGLRVLKITEDNHGNIWFGTQAGGLYKMDPETHKIILYTNKTGVNHTISSNGIHSLFFDKKTNTLFAGTENGLNIYNEADDNFINAINTDSRHPECGLLNSKWITNLFVEDSLIWFSMLNGELLLYHRNLKKIEPVNELLKFKIEKSYEEYHFIRDFQNDLWISSYTEGIRVLGNSTLNVSIINSEAKQKNGLSSNICKKIFKDRDENIWISTAEGLNYFNLKRQFFDVTAIANPLSNPIELNCITKGTENNIWLGTSGYGLIKYNLDNGKQEYYLNKKHEKICAENIWTLFTSSIGEIWIGGENGLIRHVPEQNTFEKFNLEYVNFTGKRLQDVTGIFEDSGDTLWIMTWDGPLFLLDSKRKIFVEAYKIPGLEGLKNVGRVVSVAEDKNKNLWLGSLKEGLFRWNRKNRKLERFSHEEGNKHSVSSDQIRSIYISSDNSIWVGTVNGFLNKYDEANNQFIHFDKRDGIPDATILTITEDYEGNLWIGSEKGLCVFSITDSSVRIFNAHDGLPEYPSYRNFVALANKRKIVLVCFSSLVSFEPEKIKRQQINTEIHITNIKLFDHPLTNLEAAGNKAHIDLKPKDNYVSIEYAAIDFLHSNKIKYYYKLEGFNDNWIDNGDKRSVSFSNLEGGNYTLLVKCINADGVWSKPAILRITKRPHFVQTNWFRLLATFLLASLIIGYIRYRVTDLRKQKFQLEKMVDLRTKQLQTEKERAERSEKFKEEFLANMSHEIRTPMNAVVGLSNLLLNTKLNEKQKNYLDAIRESSGNLMVILNDILDLSKIEAGKMEFETIEFSLIKVIKNVEDILRLKAEEKGLFLKSSVQSEIPNLLLGDPTRLSQILLNLISNAIKFTEKGGVTIVAEKKEETPENIRLLFKVTDTGIGIPADRLIKIFESFEQAAADTTRKFGGTGLGLSISKKLVELQGGNITVRSTHGAGSEFSFDILYHLPELESENKQESESHLNPSVFNGLNVLIVEDNEFNQMVAVDTLLAFNDKMHIEVADSGIIALKMSGIKKYDVILMDIQMPEMNGYEVTGIIRNSIDGLNKMTPIVAMTANASKSEIEKCFAADMNEYVSKPFEPNNLFQKISKVINRIT